MNQNYTEKEWWDTYADLEGKIWNYNPFLSWAVRRGYLKQLEDFLYKPGGRVLDIGCGDGWVSLRLARKGMFVHGIDFSETQIALARQLVVAEGLDKWAHFECVSSSDLPKHSRYDAVIIHAALHHLNREQRLVLLSDIADLLTPNGRLYLYEPMAPVSERHLWGQILDKGMGMLLQGLRYVTRTLSLTDAQIYAAFQSGWIMRSPNESPIQLDALKVELPPTLHIHSTCYWHVFAIAYANFCMELRPLWQNVFGLGVFGFKLLDWLVLSSGYGKYLRSWPMAAIMIERSVL
jgi:2-polyprenyl-3-methyl-5-hydroxy-6-metoxy-1,4-benzoquinol methylase